MTRKFLLEQSLQGVLQRMKLRKPQRDCVKNFHEIFVDLPDRLANVSREDVLETFRGHQPGWDFGGGFPSLTCALATGVGKTRVMGALMAYLFKSNESSNFLLLAPRTTIIDKLIRECSIHHPKYIFVDSAFVQQPFVCHAGNFEAYDPRQKTFEFGPTIWIVSPQAIAGTTGEDTLRFRRKSEFLNTSPFEYLKSLDDLVVLFDESHHLGGEENGVLPAWTQAVRELEPRLLFEMTASPRQTANILHEYTLTECLREGLYTKAVQVIVEQRPNEVDDEEWDRIILRFALDRLAVKERELNSRMESDGEELGYAPMVLVAAKDKDHAEKVTEWLQTQLDDPKAVLLVHSGMNERQYLGRLLDVERPSSKVRVIVNVFMLTEGWDVTNVYVIAPLRALATVTGVLQTMGRGLRLPFGRRIGTPEIDTLDVLCFGRNSMNQVVDEVLGSGFGSRSDGETYIDVTRGGDVEREAKERKTYTMTPVRAVNVTLPEVELERPHLDLSELEIPDKLSRDALAINLVDPETIRKLEGKAGFEWDKFLMITTARVLKKNRLIGSVTSAAHIQKALERYLSRAGLSENDLILIEPELAAGHIADSIDRMLARSKAVYTRREGDRKIEIGTFEISVPGEFKKELDSASLNASNWKPQYKGWPVAGWGQRCVYKAVPFDNPTELHVAKVIDRSEEVEWWLRNIRQVLYLNTPVGTYAPDFLFILRVSSFNVLLEVKGEHLASGMDSEPIVKALAAEEWCKAINETGSDKWQHWLVLERDAKKASTVNDLREIADEWRALYL